MTPIVDTDQPPSAAKAHLRRQLRARRQALSQQQQTSASRAILRSAVHSRLFGRSKRIGAYLANDGEICLRTLIHAAWLAHKQVFLPAITGDGTMEFRRYRPGDKLRPSHFGILEPSADKEPLAATELDIVFTPLVGFDQQGNRLGMGGGFYDRALSHVPARVQRPQLVGIAHSVQQVEQIPLQAWDRPLGWILTENGLMKMPPRRRSRTA